MRYYILAAGLDPERFMVKLNGENILDRTLRLLEANGIPAEDITLTLTPKLEKFLKAEGCRAAEISHEINLNLRKYWSACFNACELSEPACYIFGDVVYSPQAIHIIVTAQTEDIAFFASAKPLAPNYPKHWAEPFGFKVQDTRHFIDALEDFTYYASHGCFKRWPLAWELWQVIKRTPLNVIDYTNYTVINDYTCDIDEPKDILEYKGGEIWQPSQN